MKPPLIITTESKMPKDSAKTLSTLLDDLRSFHFSTTPNLRSSQDSCRATCDNRSHGIYRAWRKIWVRPRGLLCYCKSEWVYWSCCILFPFWLRANGERTESTSWPEVICPTKVNENLSTGCACFLPLVKLAIRSSKRRRTSEMGGGYSTGVQHYMKYCGISLILWCGIFAFWFFYI